MVYTLTSIIAVISESLNVLIEQYFCVRVRVYYVRLMCQCAICSSDLQKHTDARVLIQIYHTDTSIKKMSEVMGNILHYQGVCQVSSFSLPRLYSFLSL